MIEIRLSWPESALFPNARGGRHWASFQKHKEKARTDGYMAAKAAVGIAKPELSHRVPLSITFATPNRIRRDIDGMHGAIKHHLDGIAKALGVDDSVFRPVLIDVELDPAKRGFVRVEVGNGAT
ncbi:hypothetical protein L1889_18210 [Paenalcaligenes niemegkensis]|uniref:hypothetical protein n=1 Tax=Paenalcaligenes niemegkensis TaxID=2895469 RepID=UPI001EE916E6|nr:hypothetical protein [Paenalcaligenes niemegkensis]MCQ9618374.1 hypothetical protein [Paenalcaligenes niemegkensis]